MNFLHRSRCLLSIRRLTQPFPIGVGDTRHLKYLEVRLRAQLHVGALGDLANHAASFLHSLHHFRRHQTLQRPLPIREGVDRYLNREVHLSQILTHIAIIEQDCRANKCCVVVAICINYESSTWRINNPVRWKFFAKL